MDVGIVESLLKNVEAPKDAVLSAGVTPVCGSVSEVKAAAPDVMLVGGDEGVRAAVEHQIKTPLLPIAASVGLLSIAEEAVEDAIRSLRNGAGTTIHRYAMEVRVGSAAPVVGVIDGIFVTAEPAMISEYEITSAGNHVAEYRADGIVVATSAGSNGYARAAGCPIVAPEAEGLAVVTIAPYRTTPDHWILDRRDLHITITRDESDVVGYVDGNAIGAIGVGQPVSIDANRAYRTVRLPQSASPFENGNSYTHSQDSPDAKSTS